ncbi:unnamed protein product, partial [Musa acuminata subsp. burmannicoides]
MGHQSKKGLMLRLVVILSSSLVIKQRVEDRLIDVNLSPGPWGTSLCFVPFHFSIIFLMFDLTPRCMNGSHEAKAKGGCLNRSCFHANSIKELDCLSFVDNFNDLGAREECASRGIDWGQVV